MDKIEEIVSHGEVERVHANANFGSRSKRGVLNDTVLQCAFGYHVGHTAQQICTEHGLLRKNRRLTEKGFRYLRACWDINAVPLHRHD